MMRDHLLALLGVIIIGLPVLAIVAAIARILKVYLIDARADPMAQAHGETAYLNRARPNYDEDWTA